MLAPTFDCGRAVRVFVVSAFVVPVSCFIMFSRPSMTREMEELDGLLERRNFSALLLSSETFTTRQCCKQEILSLWFARGLVVVLEQRRGVGQTGARCLEEILTTTTTDPSPIMRGHLLSRAHENNEMGSLHVSLDQFCSCLSPSAP